jgi:hypothetical protein
MGSAKVERPAPPHPFKKKNVPAAVLLRAFDKLYAQVIVAVIQLYNIDVNSCAHDSSNAAIHDDPTPFEHLPLGRAAQLGPLAVDLLAQGSLRGAGGVRGAQELSTEVGPRHLLCWPFDLPTASKCINCINCFVSKPTFCVVLVYLGLFGSLSPHIPTFYCV